MKIKSVSDVITNSSSEVFIVKTNRKQQSDPMKMILEVCRALELNAKEIMTWSIATKDGLVEEGWPETKCKKGDLIIRSTEDNSIPWPLLDLLEGLGYFNSSVQDIKRVHLG